MSVRCSRLRPKGRGTLQVRLAGGEGRVVVVRGDSSSLGFSVLICMCIGVTERP
jgi:hypothetical protein